MTIGTAIVASIGIICGTFIVALIIGACMNKKKTDAAAALTNELTNQITSRLNNRLNK